MSGLSAPARRDTVRVFAALSAVPLVTLATRLTAPSLLPNVGLELGFPQATGRLVDAVAILASNARVLALVVGATVLAATIPAAATWLTAALMGVASLNVALVCLAIADAGTRAAAALLPHGPIELLAYSIGGAGFLHARRRGGSSDVRLLLELVACACALLAIAAVLEVTPT